ncbi:hypothetical protein GQ457_02G019130 [Hibiscus cannabinus]
MVDDNGNWNWAKLVTLLPHSILLHLSAAKPPSPGFMRDIPAYELLDESSSLASNGVWKAVSGFRGLQRIKSFLWLLAKDKLLTNVSERSRWLWEDMRVAFESERDSHSGKLGSASLAYCQCRAPGYAGPLVDWCKLNVDGARDLSTGFSACGGLIRDHGGQWMRGFARSLGVCSPIEAELWAVHEGLVQAWVLGLRRIVAEVDNWSVKLVHFFVNLMTWSID